MPRIEFHIYQSRGLNKLIKCLFALTLFLLPYDAIKIMPSVYRPICLIPAALLFVVLLPKILGGNMNKPSIILIFFGITSLASTIACNLFKLHSFENFMDYFLTLSLLIVSFLSLSYIFVYLSKKYSKKTYAFYFFKLVSIAYLIPLVVTVIDAMTIYGVLPYAIKNVIRLIFGGNQPDRVTGTSFECSWLSSHLIFASIAYLFMFYKTHRKKYLLFFLLCGACFLLSFSLQGFMVLALFGVVFFFLNLNRIKPKYVLIIFALVVAVVVALSVTINLANQDSYFIRRLRDFTDFGVLFETDLSTFVRIGYPLLSVRMFLDNPIFGIGGANFGNYLGEYVMDYFPWAMDFYGTHDNEVYQTVAANNGTVKCLLTRVFCEFGIVSGFLFIWFLYSSSNNNKKDIFSKALSVASVVFLLQFDSLCFALLIVSMAYSAGLKKRTNPIVCGCKSPKKATNGTVVASSIN